MGVVARLLSESEINPRRVALGVSTVGAKILDGRGEGNNALSKMRLFWNAAFGPLACVPTNVLCFPVCLMPGQQLPLRGHDQQGFSLPNILGLLGQRLSFEGTEFIFFGGRHRRQTTPNRYGPSPIPILGLIGGPALKIATLVRPERQILLRLCGSLVQI